MTAAAKRAKRVWVGPAKLKTLLVPIGSLEAWPGNPRRGDIAAVRASLERFGQVRPISVTGATIVAGHHVSIAAAEMGWTHVAALDGEFADAEEARAYLIADNRTAELGSVDPELLAVQLAAIVESSSLEGTGFSEAQRAELEERLKKIREAAAPPAAFPPLNPDDLAIEHVCPACGYEWSGNPAPGKDASEAGAE